ncbi:MAG TPA: YceI family protein [Chloroflexota bacterium]|nr:YceI family protein [Chloroflexota bacterium]
MQTSFSRRRATPILALPFLAACGAQVQSSGSASVASEPTVAARPAVQPAVPAVAPPSQAITTSNAPAAAGTVVFQILPQQSQAIFRVREQLAGRELPNDAVGTTNAVTGQLALRQDGTVVSDASKITVDLRELKTDESRRDNFIKQNTLQTAQFPLAEFVPTRAEGVPSPLPTSGEYNFRLIGTMTMHGQQKETAWDVRAKRDGEQLAGTATTAVKFGDFGMTPPRVPLVLSIVDEIRLEVNLVARQGG